MHYAAFFDTALRSKFTAKLGWGDWGIEPALLLPFEQHSTNESGANLSQFKHNHRSNPGTDPIKILQRKFYATHFSSILIGYSNLSTNQGA